MASSKNSYWKKAESVITVSALVVSVAINIVQCSQTKASQEQAEREARKVEHIQRQRDEWVQKLKWELRETRVSIGRLKEDSILYRPRPWYADHDPKDAQRRDEMAISVNQNLRELEVRERSLEKQINDFLSYR